MPIDEIENKRQVKCLWISKDLKEQVRKTARRCFWETLELSRASHGLATLYVTRPGAGCTQSSELRIYMILTWLAYVRSHDSHLIGLRSVTWLSLLYKFTRFFIYFLFLSDEGPMLETLDYTIRIGSTPTFLYFDIYIHVLWDLPVTDRDKSEAGHGGPELRRFQSPCAVFT